MIDVTKNILKPPELSEFVYKLCHDSLISPGFDGFGENNSKVIIILNKKVQGIKLRLQCVEVLHLTRLKIYSNGKLIEPNKMVLKSSSIYCDDANYDASKLVSEQGVFHSKRENEPEIEVLFNEDINIDRIEVINFGYRYAYRAFSLCMFYKDPDHGKYVNFFDNWKLKKQLDLFINNVFINKDYDEEKLISLFYIACSFGDEVKAKNLYGKINDTCTKVRIKTATKIANNLMSITGYGFNQHGFIRPFKLQNKDKINNHLKQTLGLMAKLKEEFNIKSTIASGTLLGIFRDGKLIDHDDDIDITYYSNFNDCKDIIREQDAILSYLKAQGYNCQNTKHVQIQCSLASGVDLDLFPSWTNGDDVTMSPLPINKIKKSDVFPLGTIEFNGYLLPAPNDIHKVLTVNYGAEYKKSDSNWRFDWDRANQEYINIIKEKK